MTKGIFVENVILMIGGGVLTDELSTQRVDIQAFLPAAVNYALTAGRNTAISQEGNRDLPSMFYGTFTDLVVDRSTPTASITLPKGYVPLYGNEGVRSVFDNCGNYYSPLMDADRRIIKAYKDKLIDQGFYYPLGKYKVEVYTSNPLVTMLNGEYIVRAEDLDDEDELPLVGDTELLAIQTCANWFKDPRSRPADLINNKSDDANTIPR